MIDQEETIFIGNINRTKLDFNFKSAAFYFNHGTTSTNEFLNTFIIDSQIKPQTLASTSCVARLC